MAILNEGRLASVREVKLLPELVSVLTDSVYLTAVTQSCIILIIMG